MSLNHVAISGNLTRDIDLRTTAGGSSVGNFSVAVNERRKNSNGEWEDYANYVDCVLFGRRADAIAQYLTKGTKVALQGKLHYSSWQDRETGKTRSKLDVYVDEIELLSSRNGNAAPQQQRKQPQASLYGDEDIPF